MTMACKIKLGGLHREKSCGRRHNNFTKGLIRVALHSDKVIEKK